MKFAYCLHISLVIGKYSDVFRRILSGGGSGRKGYSGGSFHGGIFFGGRGFSMNRAPYFLELFKNDQKLNKKKKVFQLKVSNFSVKSEVLTRGRTHSYT